MGRACRLKKFIIAVNTNMTALTMTQTPIAAAAASPKLWINPRMVLLRIS
jgi:hypothetical protein